MKYLSLIALIFILTACSNSNKNSQSEGQLIDNGGIPPEINKIEYGPIALKGKKLFEENCAACHMVDQKLIGPPLLNVNDRREEAWLLKFIRNSQVMIKAGDPLAVKLYEDNNRMVMNSNDHLSDEEIKQILTYISEFQSSDEVLP